VPEYRSVPEHHTAPEKTTRQRQIKTARSLQNEAGRRNRHLSDRVQLQDAPVIRRVPDAAFKVVSWDPKAKEVAEFPQ
jgi:hypothetical protein